MAKFTELKAGVLTIENTSKAAKNVLIYVPNKDNMSYKLEAGASFKVTTLSAGESFTYLCQATEGLTVTAE